jgi:GxxExxY protein
MEIARKTDSRINLLTEKIIGSAITVHKQLGPGLLESVYEECLAYEFTRDGLSFQRQLQVPVIYKDIRMECGFRVDLLVEHQVVVELKAVEQLGPLHEAQILTYLKLGGWPVGLLINFNSILLKNGIHRLKNGFNEH